MSLLGGLDDEVESVLFIVREISLYRIPPMETMEGYKAADWGLANPLWKGRLRIVERESTGVTILLEDGQTGTIFARASYNNDQSVQPVLDSSRYFVIKVEDPASGNRAFLGIGFTDRTESFDFNVALQDYDKRKNGPVAAEPAQASSAPKGDYSLKEGQTFSINIPGRKGAPPKPATSSSSSSGAGGTIPLLPPPPSGKKR